MNAYNISSQEQQRWKNLHHIDPETGMIWRKYLSSEETYGEQSNFTQVKELCLSSDFFSERMYQCS
jgi:hypothetical protein